MALALGIFTQVCVLLGPETLYIRKGAAVIIDPHAEGSAVDNDKKEGSTTVEPVVSAVLGHGRRGFTITTLDRLIDRLIVFPTQLRKKPGDGSLNAHLELPQSGRRRSSLSVCLHSPS